jgi:hypothetical protein
MPKQDFASLLEGVRSRLKRYGALPDLKALVKQGCDERHLLILLHGVANPAFDDSWEHAMRMTKRGGESSENARKRLKRTVQRIRAWAQEVDAINRSRLGFLIAFGDPTGVKYRQIPPLLKEFAYALELQTHVLGPKQHVGLDGAKAVLVQHVTEQTGNRHDREVSALLAAMSGRKCSIESHANWCQRHADLLKPVENSKAASLPDPAPPPPR